MSRKTGKTLDGGNWANHVVCGEVHSDHLANDDLETMKNIEIVLLQMEIPDLINIQVAKVIDFLIQNSR